MLLTKSKFNTIDVLVSKALKTTHILIMTNKFSKSKTLKMLNILKILCAIYYIDTVDIRRKRYEKWCRKIVDKNGILWLNERHIKQRIERKNLQMTTLYHSKIPFRP